MGGEWVMEIRVKIELFFLSYKYIYKKNNRF